MTFGIRSLIGNIRQWKKSLAFSEPLIRVKINQSALLQNLRALQSVVPRWNVIPVLKSNAYGHGLALVAGILGHQEEILLFAVDSYFEVTSIRQEGITKPILTLGYTPTSLIKRNHWKEVSFAIASLQQLNNLNHEKISANVHIKFDTGMHRQGILHTDLEKVVALLHTKPSFHVTGVFSHFADAEVTNSSLTKIQIERWNKIVARLQKEFPDIVHYHIANSAGFAHAATILATAGRSGIALYGINPGNLSTSLQPVLSMESIITEIRNIQPRESVGYNGTFVAKKPLRIGTVPAGYFEGVDRRLSNRGSFLVKNKAVPILGRVSMNMSSCNLSGVDATADATISLISNKSTDPNSVESIASQCDTIPYEILVHIPAHLHREVVL